MIKTDSYNIDLVNDNTIMSRRKLACRVTLTWWIWKCIVCQYISVCFIKTSGSFSFHWNNVSFKRTRCQYNRKRKQRSHLPGMKSIFGCHIIVFVVAFEIIRLYAGWRVIWFCGQIFRIRRIIFMKRNSKNIWASLKKL